MPKDARTKIADAIMPGHPIIAQINAVQTKAKSGYKNIESIIGIN